MAVLNHRESKFENFEVYLCWNDFLTSFLPFQTPALKKPAKGQLLLGAAQDYTCRVFKTWTPCDFSLAFPRVTLELLCSVY